MSYSLRAMDGFPLLRLRRQAGLTQFQLAVKSGLSDKCIARIERGRSNPTTDTLFRLATALGVSVADLLGQAPKGRRVVA